MRPSNCAFTFPDLIAMLAATILVGCIALPVLARTNPQSRSALCLNNMRNLIAAWQAYSHDNQDRLLPSLHGGVFMGGNIDSVYGAAWASGWLDWGTLSDNTNTTILTRENSRLGSYVKRSEVFRCPADNYVSPIQRSWGWDHRVRSYSLNITIGEGNYETGDWDPIYRHVRKASEFQYPNPRETWVFAGEHPDSINDGAFFNPHQNEWIDLPSPFHNGATPFAFADGSTQMHRWQASLSRGRAVRIVYDFFPFYASPGDLDVRWVAYHTQRVSTNSF